MVHVMCDLETLGVRAGCKILSIGAVVFSPEGLGAEFYTEVQRKVQGSLLEDARTLGWWALQSAEARERLFDNQDAKPSLSRSLEQFNTWLREVAPVDDKGHLDVCVWGNGAAFDNAVLHAAYEAVAIEPPAWEFWNDRCYRTLKSLAPQIKLVRVGVHHNALDDAKSQAEHAVRILESLKAW
jgi:hypothetical protein